MHFSKVALLSAPVMAMASPVALETRQDNTCCYQTEDVNALVFVTKGQSSQTLDTLNWCYLQVDRDVTDPDNCEKATRSYWAGYCPSDGTKVIPCP
ncbi:hypothetical protein CPAR01_16296 [Colletotrichum paranaense]|uniref:Uncharacterized protein n=6 Tax=Colletotrichum acutatum species complex TaxID=2707335 RepID=A0A9Q8SKM8_9PEZI|nr:uncharacterized protein CLUP02_04608 [Colletotrichum lupini]XP_060308864.1 uncharacterized protein CCOS01_12668 [Colletotrichum costaricense]XP_060340722.1 uncharacterized protein CPAR01_16296 [Colletotrichum paranaense]XP_060377320.1 uncharacterized protein CTAM01_12045 [Colletotrichum tamarilloi]KAI3543514.1 hypothetical protein CSPX01_06170 [Colletotrichum filicis]KAK0377599.1 hypothetical protein CLIM01_05078 [Colletotrichum limetticola]KAK1461296.1 hypothetical protein CMEL01_14932 [C